MELHTSNSLLPRIAKCCPRPTNAEPGKNSHFASACTSPKNIDLHLCRQRRPPPTPLRVESSTLMEAPQSIPSLPSRRRYFRGASDERERESQCLPSPGARTHTPPRPSLPLSHPPRGAPPPPSHIELQSSPFISRPHAQVESSLRRCRDEITMTFSLSVKELQSAGDERGRIDGRDDYLPRV